MVEVVAGLGGCATFRRGTFCIQFKLDSVYAAARDRRPDAAFPLRLNQSSAALALRFNLNRRVRVGSCATHSSVILLHSVGTPWDPADPIDTGARMRMMTFATNLAAMQMAAH